MSKTKLQYNYNFSYKLICISSQLKDYRVSVFINESLKIDLKKVDDLILDNKSKASSKSFEFQHFEDNNLGIEYFLIHNKSLGYHFLPSLKSFDYVFILKSESEIENIEFM